jgi:serine phosphatase RsbU (regulator of sigma subunit)
MGLADPGGRRRIAAAAAGIAAVAGVVVLARLVGDPRSWYGLPGALAVAVAMTVGLFAGRLAGLAVGLLGAALFVPLVAYHMPPDPYLWGIPVAVVWGLSGFLSGVLGDSLRARTDDAYESVLDEADTQRRIARALQRALLPEHLPTLPGAEIATLFRPAGNGDELGGDFYDAWLIPDRPDQFGIMVGDVQGKGAEAAAVTALARHTIRTASILDVKPAEALDVLNQALLRRTSGDRFVTSFLALATPVAEGLEITLASGGHPLPIVRRLDGTASPVGQPGPLLGVWLHTEEHCETRLVLRHGELLVAYSDGATDHQGPGGIFGEARLIAAVEAAEGGPRQVLTAIREALVAFNDVPPRDDIAIIALAPKAPASSS